jgi:transcriptional regulator with XRE-family HTH domain
MTRSSGGTSGLPTSLQKRLKGLGDNIRLARKRRRMTMQDLADRMFVTRKTLKRLEAGDPGTSIGVMASALLVLGLDVDLDRVADPRNDAVGNALDRDRHQRVMRMRQPAGKTNVDLNF